jgi:hypothetical protein
MGFGTNCNQGGKKGMKRNYLELIIIMVSLMVAGCGGGGGGGATGGDNSGTAPPAEVTSVIDNFSSALESGDKNTTANTLEFPYTETTLGGTVNTYNTSADYVTGTPLSFSQFDVSNLRFVSTGANTAQVTFAVTLATGRTSSGSVYAMSAAGSAQAEFLAEMIKKASVWKIKSVTPTSINGTIVPDEVGSWLNNLMDAINSGNALLAASYIAYPFTQVYIDGSPHVFENPTTCQTIFVGFSNVSMLGYRYQLTSSGRKVWFNISGLYNGKNIRVPHFEADMVQEAGVWKSNRIAGFE